MLKRLLLISVVTTLSCEIKNEGASANIFEISNSGVSGKAIIKKTSKGTKLTVTLSGKKIQP
jgi:hypothetical protein